MPPEIISTTPFPAAPAVRERPILFSAPMVRALLAGTKTQTRRAVKLPHLNPLGEWEPMSWGGPNGGRSRSGHTVPLQQAIGHSRTGEILGCPYGQPGDRLWVRESFWIEHDQDNFENSPSFDCGVDLRTASWASVCYCADQDSPGEWFGPDDVFPQRSFMPWGEGLGLVPQYYSKRPGIHMPRWASRILLEVTDVRVERLQDISVADAIAEGAPGGHGAIPGYAYSATAIEHFRHIWSAINGADAWAANPWVWAVSFRRVPPTGGISKTPPGGSNA